MERGRANAWAVKGIAACSGDVLCITPNICQAAATWESPVSNAGHTVGYGNGGQAAAIREGIVADAGHSVWDGDGGQTAATWKSPVSDAGHTVWYGDRD